MIRKTAVCVLGLVILMVSLAACGGGDQTDDGGLGIGDPVQIGDVVVTMDSASLSTYRARVEFTVENQGSADLVIDAETTFTVEGDNAGTEVPLEPEPNCPNLLSGTVPAGGSLSGQLCWRSDPSRTWPALVLVRYAAASEGTDAETWSIEAEQ